MNYNSIEDIFSAGTTNMETIRNNTKQDDQSDAIAGVSWFSFNGQVASTIYANGNSWIGFSSASEHLKVNRRDSAMYSLYREEGTLYSYYKFLKIRWVGYSVYNKDTSAYSLAYDVILWDTGDISLRMISIPTSNNDGIYSLIASSTYTYTVSSSSPDVTFTKTASGFQVSNNIIDLPAIERRYLIRSDSVYYTVTDGNISEIVSSEITSNTFLNYGITEFPEISVLSGLTNPEILYWISVEISSSSNKKLILKGTPPLPQVSYFDVLHIPEDSGISWVKAVCSDDVLFAITFDDGITWKYYSNNTWVTVSSMSDGMTSNTLASIQQEAWNEVATSSSCQFRYILPTITSTVSAIKVQYI